MSVRPRSRRGPADGGFALLVLLAVIGAGSIGILLAVQALVPTNAAQLDTADARLLVGRGAAGIAYRRNGAFPPDLDALAAAGGLAVDGDWRYDPFGAAQAIDYRVLSTGARLRSRGPDRRFNTADDLVYLVATETQLRARQRERLRLLRAVLLRSKYRLASTMTPSDTAALRSAARDLAQARRSWLTADAAARATLTGTMNAAAATIAALVGAHALPALPSALTGSSGLMGQLGLPDDLAVDGRGAALRRDLSLGFLAAGADGAGGTDDDM